MLKSSALLQFISQSLCLRTKLILLAVPLADVLAKDTVFVFNSVFKAEVAQKLILNLDGSLLSESCTVRDAWGVTLLNFVCFNDSSESSVFWGHGWCDSFLKARIRPGFTLYH